MLEGADALAINTEWKVYQNPDYAEMRTRMDEHVIFDGRNLYEPSRMAKHGFIYYSIGRPVVALQSDRAELSV